MNEGSIIFPSRCIVIYCCLTHELMDRPFYYRRVNTRDSSKMSTIHSLSCVGVGVGVC